MHQKFVTPNNELEWLKLTYDQKKKRSFDLGKRAISRLLKEEKPVSYRTITEKSKELDPEKIGIHRNTIRSNEELYQYYLSHSTNKRVNKKRKKMTDFIENDLEGFKNIKLDRDLDRVKQRYMKATKSELVELLIRMEQYIAYQNQNWLKNEFEKYQ